MALISPVDGSKNIHFSHYSQLSVTNSFLDHFYHNSAQKTSRVCTLVKIHSILKLTNKQKHLYTIIPWVTVVSIRGQTVKFY